MGTRARTFTRDGITSPGWVTRAQSTLTGLASTLDQLIVAYGFHDGDWTWYNPNWPPGANTLTTLYIGRGYWVKVCCGCSLEYDTNTYGLDPDWNLIGWLGS